MLVNEFLERAPEGGDVGGQSGEAASDHREDERAGRVNKSIPRLGESH
jgi:hypothetical protein